jgi:NADH dehydrogenase/NADH:ubiquinone oxidoreductase subunit G
MSNSNDLLDAINRAVEGKVFSVEVLQNIAELRKSVDEQAAKIKQFADTETLLRAENNALKDRVTALKTAENSVIEREKKVAVQELEQALLAKETELTKTFKNELKEVVMAAFKNPTIKQEMFGNESQPGANGGYPQTLPVNKVTTTTQD